MTVFRFNVFFMSDKRRSGGHLMVGWSSSGFKTGFCFIFLLVVSINHAFLDHNRLNRVASTYTVWYLPLTSFFSPCNLVMSFTARESSVVRLTTL